MRVARPRHILTARTILHCQHTLRDHLTRRTSNDMDPQNPIRLRVRQELDHTIRVQVRLRSRVRTEGEAADIVLDAVLLQLLLVGADPRDFGVRVHNAGNAIVVDVAVALCDVFDAGDGFFFGFVREHGTEGAVADDADVGELGAELLVDDQASAVVGFNADVFETEAGGVGASADGDENDVGFELGRLLARRVFGVVGRTYDFLLAALSSLNVELDC